MRTSDRSLTVDHIVLGVGQLQGSSKRQIRLAGDLMSERDQILASKMTPQCVLDQAVARFPVAAARSSASRTKFVVKLDLCLQTVRVPLSMVG